MKKIQVYVYEPPHRHSPVSPLSHSPKLFGFLSSKHIEYEEVAWDGRLESLPETSVMIRASIHLGAQLGLRWDELVSHSQGLHVVFYDDRLVGPEGEVTDNFEDLINTVETYLHRLTF